MEKIKGLLLFGILTLLGIGSGFCYPITPNDYVNYYDLSGNNAVFNTFNSLSTPITFFNSSFVSSIITPFIYKESFSGSPDFDINNYTLSSNRFNWINSSYDLYFNPNGNGVAVFLGANYSSSSYSWLLPVTAGFSSLTSSDYIDITNGYFVRVLGNSSCFSSGIMSSLSDFCISSFVEIFANYPYTISSLGNIYDSNYNGTNYYKGPVGTSIGNGYSFAFLDGSGDIHYKSILFSGSNANSINNILIYRLNSLSFVDSSSSYLVGVLGIDSSDFSYIYSIYSCPYNSTSIYSCSFVEGGKTNLSYNDESFNNFLTNSGSSRFLSVQYSSINNKFTLKSSSEFSISLTPTDGIDIIGSLPSGGGNGNQSTGSQSVSSLYYSCLGPTYNTPDGKPPIYCFDSSGNFNADRLRTCFSDLIVTGGELQSSTFCNIDGFVQSVEFIGDGSGVSIVPCTSDSCYSSLIIGQSYINLDPVNNVTTGLVLDMITNLTGWIGRCPFPYVDFGFGSTFKVFSYLKSLGYNIDPFIPINCAVAGFHAGRNTIFEGLNFTIFNIPILNGDSKNFKILFRFFDVLLIFAIFGIFWFFRKHI